MQDPRLYQTDTGQVDDSLRDLNGQHSGFAHFSLGRLSTDDTLVDAELRGAALQEVVRHHDLEVVHALVALEVIPRSGRLQLILVQHFSSVQHRVTVVVICLLWGTKVKNRTSI